MSPGKVIRAAQAVLGSHVADDYELLSALAHPVGLVLWTGDAARLPAASITEAQAELLAKVIGSGLHVVGHNALAMLDLAAEWTVQLPARGP
jgi:hypothetical protein